MENERRDQYVESEPKTGVVDNSSDSKRDQSRVDEDSISKQDTVQVAKAMDRDLYISLTTRKIDECKSILEDNVEHCFLNQVTPQENTVLHLAAMLDLEELIGPLIRRDRELVSCTNSKGDAPLHVAASAGHLSAVQSLVKFAREEKSSGSNHGDLDLETMLKMKNKDGETALHLALKHHQKKVAQYLIENDPEASYCLNAQRESPLFLAAKSGFLDLVTVMIDSPVKDIDIDEALKMGKSVVHGAICRRNIDVLDAILRKHSSLLDSTDDLNAYPNLINPKSKSYTHRVSPLSYAAYKGYVDMVCCILKRSSNTTYRKDTNGFFPIHMAAAGGRIEVIKEILCRCPDSKELLTSEGENILHVAAKIGQEGVVRYILKTPDLEKLVSERDDFGNSPLHLASKAGHPSVVDILTWDQRVKLDLENHEGQTGMDLALSYEGPMPSVKELLTWLALRYAGIPKGKHPHHKSSIMKESPNKDNYMDRTNGLLVIVTLVITVTFAAGFTVPGGNSDKGVPNFLNKREFKQFTVVNTVAFYSSLLDALFLILALAGDRTLSLVFLNLAMLLLGISLGAMAVAFFDAVYLIVDSIKWLVLVVRVILSIFYVALAVLVVVLLPLIFPLSIKHRIFRYIGHISFKVMLFISQWK